MDFVCLPAQPHVPSHARWVYVAAAAIADGAPAFSFKLSSNLAHRLEIVRGTGRNLPVWVVQFERDVETVAVVVENEKSRRIAVDAAFQENPNWFVVGSHSIVPGRRAGQRAERSRSI